MRILNSKTGFVFMTHMSKLITMLEYQIIAQVKSGGEAQAEANHSSINFDVTSGKHYTLPNPAELLLLCWQPVCLRMYSAIRKY